MPLISILDFLLKIRPIEDFEYLVSDFHERKIKQLYWSLECLNIENKIAHL